MNTIIMTNFIQIEADILLNKDLNNTDKVLYGWISALTNNRNNECFANTKYLMKIMNLKERQIRRSLIKLKKYDYIDIEIKSNNKRVITTKLNKFLDQRTKNNKQTQLYDYNWLDDFDE